MIRYQADFGPQYFVEWFRKSVKLQARSVRPNPSAPVVPISVVTTCMNRLRDLRLTLPKNIADHASYPAEFVLLDYSSTDGLGDWVRSEMWDHVQSGRLVYYRLDGEPHFRYNHSRNVSFRLATHGIVTNVDADNYMHEGFLDAIRQCAAPRVLVVPDSFLSPTSSSLVLRGRFAMAKEDIFRITGFDEDLDDSYSQDDVNFVLRAMLDGLSTCRFADSFLANRIETPMAERTRLTRKSQSRDVNARITRDKLARCAIRANRGLWGAATVTRNFGDVITLAGGAVA
jgi:hypothetical protein